MTSVGTVIAGSTSAALWRWASSTTARNSSGFIAAMPRMYISKSAASMRSALTWPLRRLISRDSGEGSHLRQVLVVTSRASRVVASASGSRRRNACVPWKLSSTRPLGPASDTRPATRAR